MQFADKVRSYELYDVCTDVCMSKHKLYAEDVSRSVRAWKQFSSASAAGAGQDSTSAVHTLAHVVVQRLLLDARSAAVTSRIALSRSRAHGSPPWYTSSHFRGRSGVVSRRVSRSFIANHRPAPSKAICCRSIIMLLGVSSVSTRKIATERVENKGRVKIGEDGDVRRTKEG